MEITLRELKPRFEDTYSVVRYFVLGIDHAAVRKSRSIEQMLLPFCPPLLIRLSDEGGWNPL